MRSTEVKGVIKRKKKTHTERERERETGRQTGRERERNKQADRQREGRGGGRTPSSAAFVNARSAGEPGATPPLGRPAARDIQHTTPQGLADLYV